MDDPKPKLPNQKLNRPSPHANPLQKYAINTPPAKPSPKISKFFSTIELPALSPQHSGLKKIFKSLRTSQSNLKLRLISENLLRQLELCYLKDKILDFKD